jgi:hypothetical protein
MYDALKAAGWEYMAPVGGPWVGNPPASIPITALPGVGIFVDPAKSKQLTPAVEALGNALFAENIKTFANVSGYPKQDPNQQEILQIVIGVRAVP